MNSRNLKSINRNKKEVTVKTISLWAFVLVVIIVCVIFGVKACNKNKKITNYHGVEMVSGQEVFNRSESSYFVLVYGFNGEKENETFDKTFFEYLEYQRNYSSKEGVLKVYGADIDDYSNKVSLTTGDSNINGTTTYAGNKLETDNSLVLRINSKELPVLLVISEGKVDTSYIGESNILNYLQTLKK